MMKRETETPLIELIRVGRSYLRPGKDAAWALRNVSLQIHAGEFICITGPSGSGKSTLLNLIGCLDTPSAGSYRLDGRDVHNLDSDAQAWLRRKVFGFVFQSYHLVGTATAQGNVELPGLYAGIGKAARRSRARALLGKLGLDNRTEHLPAELSGGQQQRVSIARALMNGGRVILADEPTGALDQQNGEKIIAELETLAREGHTVIMVSHNPQIAHRAYRQIELGDGQIVSDQHHADEPISSSASPSRIPGSANQPMPIGTGSAAEILLGSLSSLRNLVLGKQRLRAILSIVGIAVAVWWTIGLSSVVEGNTQAQLEIVNEMDARQISLLSTQLAIPGASDPAVSLTIDDAVAIKNQIANVRSTVPKLVRFLTVQNGSLNMQAFVHGELPQGRSDSSPADSNRLQAGSALSAADNDRLESVAVIGPGVRDRLFEPSQNPVGQFVTISNLPFRIKGVAAANRLLISEASEESQVQSILGAAEENFIYVPFNTGASLLFGTSNLRVLDVWVDQPALINETAKAIGDLLIRRHGSEGFTMYYRAERTAEVMETRATLNLFVAAIGSVALLAGGLGAMTVMLMTVTKRRQEIGIRMAIGARRVDIHRQFLFEAILTVMAGGLIGFMASMATLPLATLLGVPVVLSVWSIWAACAAVAGVGVVFSLLPARRAARLNPIAALATS